MKSIKGITLISLVIMILVLIILSSISIYLLLGENGIFNKAEYAKNETIKQAATEKMNLKITNIQIEKYADEQRMPTLQEFANGLCVDNEIEYVELKSKNQAALDKIEVGDASSIFTKLKEYPYEFEINSSLQLASIDGVKTASTSSSDTISREEYNALLTRILALETTGSTNPTGTIIAYSVNNVPSGYLKCEGQAISRADYSNLFNIIGTTYGSGDGSTTFNVPDLRGEFLRGTGTNSHKNQGNGSNVGEHQDGTEIPNMYAQGAGGGYIRYITSGTTATSLKNYDSSVGTGNYNRYSGQSSAETGTYTLNYTSRPTNTSVLYCIKY